HARGRHRRHQEGAPPVRWRRRTRGRRLWLAGLDARHRRPLPQMQSRPARRRQGVRRPHPSPARREGVHVRGLLAQAIEANAMDPKPEFPRLWKDVQDSAREFAHLSLQMSSKALDFTAQQIRTLEQTIKAQAEKLAPEKPAEPKADAEP